jgi:CheY-like chemotaxis protein
MSNKLLLADDSITIRKVVGIIFANEDYTLSVVDNGNAALEKAREIIPDIILADVQMPGNTGYEVCTEVRRDPALKHIPLLLLTGAFEPFDEEKARQSGADDFISKPFESQQLIEKVKSLIALGKERKMSLPVPEPAAAVSPQLSPEQFIVPAAEASFLGEMGGEFPPVEEVAGQPSLQMDQLSAVEEIAEEPSLQADQLSATEEIIEASPEEDLWDVFTLEEVAEGEAADLEAILEEDAGEPFNEDETVEEFAFAKEEETTPLDAGLEEAGAPSMVTAEIFDHIGEKPSIAEEAQPLAEPVTGGVFEFADEPEEQATFVSGLDEAPPVTAPAEPEFELQFAPEKEHESLISPVNTPVLDEVFDFEVEAEEQTVVSGFDETLPPPLPGKPEVELQFAPEEEYVPVLPPVEHAAPPVPPAAPVAQQPPVQGEAVLSEEQLASIVAKISRDIIEKIAWEVVPDLAETLIRDEIRKLKEGLRG